MAIIECPECRNKVSDQATTCPHCGFNIKKYTKGLSSNKRTNKKTKSDSKLTKMDNIELLIEDFFDNVGAIPIIGKCLRLLLIVLFILLFCITIIGIFAAAFLALNELSPDLCMIAILLLGLVISYFASYKWGKRKKWYFWFCVIVAIGWIYLWYFYEF